MLRALLRRARPTSRALSTAPLSQLALMFPGQGAQAIGMTADLVSEFPQARFVLEEADEALSTFLSRKMHQGTEVCG
jgi:acyl transferase domain-containing protein